MSVLATAASQTKRSHAGATLMLVLVYATGWRLALVLWACLFPAQACNDRLTCAPWAHLQIVTSKSNADRSLGGIAVPWVDLARKIGGFGMSAAYGYLRNGKEHGPVTSAALKSLAASGQLGPRDL